jgi:hypothetical protein
MAYLENCLKEIAAPLGGWMGRELAAGSLCYRSVYDETP